MRCLNSPATLNALELQIVESTPVGAKHVLVMNGGDGRLVRAICEKLGRGAAVSVVTMQPGLMKFLDDLPDAGSRAWDLAWHEARVSAHGAYDFVVFYQLHEFWRGELFGLRRLLALAEPGALIWTSFLNAQATRIAARFLPEARLGFGTLGEPTRVAAAIDYASFMDFILRSEGELVRLWGMVEQNAWEFCQKRGAMPETWDLRGSKVKIGTLADAFLWGASAVAVAFRLGGDRTNPAAPRVSCMPYSAVLFQGLVLPYPEEQLRETTLCAAELEIAAWRRKPVEKPPQLVQLLLDQVGDLPKNSRALIIGVGWGRDLLLMRRILPAWEWVGVETDGRLLALGRDLVASEKVATLVAEPGAPLPFANNSFDVAFSFGYFSSLYEPAARHVAMELRRVTKGPIHQLEDGRGPEHDIQLKRYSLKSVYAALECEAVLQPVLIDGKPNGLYFVKVAGRN